MTSREGLVTSWEGASDLLGGGLVTSWERASD